MEGSFIVLSESLGLNCWWVPKENSKNVHEAIIILNKKLYKNIILKFKVAQL